MNQLIIAIIFCLNIIHSHYEDSITDPHPHNVYLYRDGKVIIKDFSFYIYNKNNYMNDTPFLSDLFDAIEDKNWVHIRGYRKEMVGPKNNQFWKRYLDGYGLELHLNENNNGYIFTFYFDNDAFKVEEHASTYNFKEKIIFYDTDNHPLTIDGKMTMARLAYLLSHSNFQYEQKMWAYEIKYGRLKIWISFKLFEKNMMYAITGGTTLIGDPDDRTITDLQIFE